MREALGKLEMKEEIFSLCSYLKPWNREASRQAGPGERWWWCYRWR